MTDAGSMSEAKDLKELLRNAIADEGFGLTLRSGEVTVVHTVPGPSPLEAVVPTHDELWAFLRQLAGSRLLAKDGPHL